MGLNYEIRDISERLRRMIHFENFNKAIEQFLTENTRFVEYYMRILTIKMGYNLICYGTLCVTS